MDWLRIGAFALLIFYHVGMVFVPWGYHVKTEHPVDWATIPMLATNAWRLPLLFAVSGYASVHLLARRDGRIGAFLRERSARLLVPLAFGMAVIVPPQSWVELVGQHGYQRGYLAFWGQDYFAGQVLDGIVLPTWNHLWFIVYLWVYTLLLGLLACLPAGLRDRIARGAGHVFAGPRVILVPLALLFGRMALHWPLPDETHDLVHDLHAHEVYFGLFLFGCLLAGSDRLWQAIRAWWWVAAVLALAGYAVVAVLNIPGLIAGPWPLWAQILVSVARDIQGWDAIIALIGLADRYWNHDHHWRATLNEAVFPFYIIHQTIIVVVASMLIGHGVAPAVQFATLVIATTAGCWLFYLAGRALGPLRPLVGLRWRPARLRRPAAAGRDARLRPESR